MRNLPFSISPEELYEIFGKYGALRQVRVGSTKDTRGTAYVVYEDIFDAKNACEHLSGFNVQNRYLIVLYHQPKRQATRSLKDQEAEIKAMQEKPPTSCQDSSNGCRRTRSAAPATRHCPATGRNPTAIRPSAARRPAKAAGGGIT